MGKKKPEEAPAPAPEVKDAEAEEEDTPVVKALKELDDKMCNLELEFEKEMEALRRKTRQEKQAPLLEERSKVLADVTNASEQDKKLGTPACKNFWLQAIQNDDNYAEMLEEWDEPVLEYLVNVKRLEVNDDPASPDLKLEFLFKENPYFTNTTLTVEALTDYDEKTYKPWKDPACIEVKATPIDWKPGQNVTVEVVQKKTKGGGAKKAKQKAKAKEEPRDSIFRHLFRNLKVGDEPPPELKDMIKQQGGDDMDSDEEGGGSDTIVKMALEQCYSMAHDLAEQIIPYAVRYYTGEAGDEIDDDEGSESEDDEDDDEDDEDSEEDVPPPRGAKKKPQKKAGGGAPAGGKQEECKQQ